MGAGLKDLSISNALIPTYLCISYFLEALTSAPELFKVLHVYCKSQCTQA